MNYNKINILQMVLKLLIDFFYPVKVMEFINYYVTHKGPYCTI